MLNCANCPRLAAIRDHHNALVRAKLEGAACAAARLESFREDMSRGQAKPPVTPSVVDVVASFPSVFCLRGHEGSFRASYCSSYTTERGVIMVYTQKQQPDGSWSDFSKGTPDELWAQVRG